MKLIWGNTSRGEKLPVFSSDANLYLINVVLKISFLLLAIREDHAAVTVLDSSNPLTLVAGPVCPVHLAVAITFVILVFAFISVPACPLKLTKAALLVIYVISFICI